MPTRSHIVLIAGLILVLIVGSATATYMVMAERSAREKAQVASDLLQKQYNAAASDMAKRDAAYQATLRTYQAQLAHVKTVADVSKALSQPSSVPLVFNPFEVTPAPTRADPEAVSVAVAQDKIVPLYQNLAQCTLDKMALGKCQLDIASMVKERDAAQGQADAWKKAVKGSKMAHLWFAFKVAGCGALGTAPGLVAKDTKVSILGAAAASGFCALTMHW